MWIKSCEWKSKEQISGFNAFAWCMFLEWRKHAKRDWFGKEKNRALSRTLTEHRLDKFCVLTFLQFSSKFQFYIFPSIAFVIKEIKFVIWSKFNLNSLQSANLVKLWDWSVSNRNLSAWNNQIIKVIIEMVKMNRQSVKFSHT